MRHISENRIVSIAASSENPEFPIERVLDNHPGRPYRSASPAQSTVTITAGVLGGCSDIMIAGTNAGNVSVTATDPNAVQFASMYQQLIPYTEPIITNLDTAVNVVDGSYDAQTAGIVFGDNSVQREAYFSIDNSYLLQVFSFYVKMADSGVPVPSRSSITGDFSLVLNGGISSNISTPVITHVGNNVYRIYAWRNATGNNSNFGIAKYTTQSNRGFTVSKINLIRTDDYLPMDYSPNHSGGIAAIISHEFVDIGDSSVIANIPVSVSGTVVQRSETNSMWIKLDSTLNVPTELSIVLTGPIGQPCEVGIITSKVADTYGGRDPQYGISEQPDDSASIHVVNSNGSEYYKKRNTVRSYSGITILMNNSEVFKFMAMSRRIGLTPSAWKITDATGNDWVIYARFDGAPTVQYAHKNHSIVTFNLLEVI